MTLQRGHHLDLNGGFILSVTSMEVRRRMIIP